MPFEYTKLLGFNQCQKSDKVLSITYADLDFLIKKVDECKNNPEKSSTTEVGEHVPCLYLMFDI